MNKKITLAIMLAVAAIVLISPSIASDSADAAPVTGVTLNKNLTYLMPPNTEQLSATVLPADATDKIVTWSSTNAMVANVDGSGKITAVNFGQATVTVTTNEGGFTATCKVIVGAQVTGITLDKSTITIPAAGSEKLTATISPADAAVKDVTWSSSNSSVASVDASGNVFGINAGTATITVTTADGGLTATCSVTVTSLTAVTGVTVDKTSMTIPPSGTGTITATVNPAGASNKNVTWSSSNTAVATVDSNGVVTATGTGTATITVTTAEGGYTATCAVTIGTPVTGVTIDKSAMSIPAAGSEKITATISPAGATNKNVTWSSSNSSVASVDASGNVFGINAGTATITVTTADGGFTASCNVTITALAGAVTGVAVDKGTITIPVAGTEKITATVSPASATNKNVTWSSSNNSVASVDGSGNVFGINAGTATITVTTADGGFTATCTVTVTPLPGAVTGVALDKYTMSLTLGGNGQLTATVSPAGAINKNVSWSSSNNSVATVNSTGRVTAAGTGTATITVTTVDGGHTASCTVTVTGGSISIHATGVTLNTNVLNLTSGNTGQLTATVSPANASNKSVTWSSSNNAVATVSNNGLVTAFGDGTATITVRTTDGNHTATCNVMVSGGRASVPATGVTLDKDKMSLAIGDKGSLTATVSPSDATNKGVTWSSSNAAVATVDGNGVVTAAGAGTATITVTTNDGNHTASCAVNVSGGGGSRGADGGTGSNTMLYVGIALLILILIVVGTALYLRGKKKPHSTQ